MRGAGVIPDVDEWLDSFTPEIYREFLASESLDPDETNHTLKRIAEILKRGFAVISSAWSESEIDPNEFEPDPEIRKSATGDSERSLNPNEFRDLLAGYM